MKKTLYYLFAAIALIAAASCQKEVQPQEADEMSGRRVVIATFAANEDGTKTTIDGMSPKWSDGDQVYVSDGWETGTGDCSHFTVVRLKSGPGSCSDTEGIILDGGESFAFIVPSSFSYPVYAVYPASAIGGIYNETKEGLPFNDVAAFEIPDGVNTDYPDGSFSSANICVAKVEAGGNKFSFQNVTSIIKIDGKASSIKSVQISNATQAIAGSFYYDFSTGNVGKVYPDATQNIKSITTDVLPETGPYYIALAPVTLPAGTEFSFKDKGPEETGVETVGAKRISAGKTLGKNKIYNIGYAMDGVLPGAFSVSDTKKVFFSKGNLQAHIESDGTPSSWKFAAHQYTYLGTAGANQTIGSSAGDVDLFGWSTVATNYGINTSESSSTYSGDFVDWGTAIGGVGTWRTLTYAEWMYLLGSGRGIGDTYFKYGVTVCGMLNCLVIAPDGNTVEIKDVYTSNGTGGTAKWPDAEALGFVCLPAGGFREGSLVWKVALFACYWSSSAYDASEAYFTISSNIGEYADDSAPRYSGYSVRLVTE